MKSLSIRAVAGNAKLNGKLSKLMSCKCCVVTNFTWRERWREAKKEIKRIIKGERDEA